MLDKKTLAIVEKAIAGDKDAFIQLCEIKGRDILYISAHFMGNITDGEDAAQEVLMYMYKHLEDIKRPEAFHAWLYQVTRNICIDVKRKYKRKRLLFYEQPEGVEKMEVRMDYLPYEFYEDGSKRDMVLEIINKLPQTSKMCVLFFYYENMTYEEIAVALQITKKDVDNNLMKAKKMIRKKLGKEYQAKEFLSKMFSLAPTPILAKILQYEAESMVSGSIVEEFLDIGKGITGGTIVVKSVLSGSGVTAGSNGGAAAGISAKVTIGVVTTVSAAAIGTGIYSSNQPNPETTVPVEPVVSVEEEEEREEVIPVAAEEPTEQKIETLEEMIGAEAAGQLQQYVEAQQAEISYQELIGFVEQLELENVESYVQSDIGQSDTLYILEKQDKKLMVIVRRNERDDGVGVAFLFTEIVTEQPRSFDIEFAFDDWRL